MEDFKELLNIFVKPYFQFSLRHFENEINIVYKSALFHFFSIFEVLKLRYLVFKLHMVSRVKITIFFSLNLYVGLKPEK